MYGFTFQIHIYRHSRYRHTDVAYFQFSKLIIFKIKSVVDKTDEIHFSMLGINFSWVLHVPVKYLTRNLIRNLISVTKSNEIGLFHFIWNISLTSDFMLIIQLNCARAVVILASLLIVLLIATTCSSLNRRLHVTKCLQYLHLHF